MRIRQARARPLTVVDYNEPTPEIRPRTEVQIMLSEAVERRDAWLKHWQSTKLTRKDNVEALRNYTALRGVVKTLQWVMLNPEIEHPLD